VAAPYAAKYVQDMLGKADKVTSQDYQAYPGGGGPGGQALPNGQVAGFSDLQNQSFNAAQNLGTTPQLETGSNFAYGAGAGSMGNAQNAQGYGQMGAQYGASFGQNATNPNAVGAYMNPYLQQSLAPQMALLQEQQGMQQAANQGQATQAGAFGGSRMGVQNAQQNQANQLAMSNLVGQGYNNAYNNAIQNMGQAATLGMQGANAGQAGVANANQAYAGANAAAGQLGNLGNIQYGQQVGNINLQNQLGGQQQQYQQNLDTTAYQNYQNSLQLPYQQLGFMSNLLNAQPTQGSQTSVYSNPSPISVAAGVGTAALGASNLMGKKAAGGQIKERKMAQGGLVSLALHKMARS
jgi:hypothetical protein